MPYRRKFVFSSTILRTKKEVICQKKKTELSFLLWTPYELTLHEIVNCLQEGEVVVADVSTKAEVETGISSVNHFKVAKFNEIRVFCIPEILLQFVAH